MFTARILWMHHIQETKSFLPALCLEKIHSSFHSVFPVGCVLASFVTFTFHEGQCELFRAKYSLGFPEIRD